MDLSGDKSTENTEGASRRTVEVEVGAGVKAGTREYIAGEAVEGGYC